MKRIITFLLIVSFSCFQLTAVDVVKRIKQVYKQLNKERILSEIKSNYAIYQASKYNKSTQNSFDFQLYTPVILLQLHVDNSKQFSSNGSAYDMLCVDSNNVEVAFLDKESLLYATIQTQRATPSDFEFLMTADGGMPSYFKTIATQKDTLPEKIINDRAISIRDIQRLQPDVILSFNQLAQTFLFLKADKIYVYRIQFHDSFELDSYVDIVIRGRK